MLASVPCEAKLLVGQEAWQSGTTARVVGSQVLHSSFAGILRKIFEHEFASFVCVTHHDAACTKKNKRNSRGFVLSFDYNFMFLSGTRCLRPKYSREQQGDLEEEHQKLQKVA